MAETSFNTEDFIAGQKPEEVEANVEIVKRNPHHHFEVAALLEAGIQE